MQAEQDELDEILKTSVPGLVSKTRQKCTPTDSSRDGQGNSGTGHKILLEPSVFNMSLLLPPSLSFIQRLKDIVPVDADIALSTLTSFLDDFLVNVFLPQLDETVTDLCTLSFIAPDAFTEDPQWSKSSPRPVFKASTCVFISSRSIFPNLKYNRELSNSCQSYGSLVKCCPAFRMIKPSHSF
jgi:Xaa-Pro aminopeptidase